jgi:hypothetical protein
MRLQMEGRGRTQLTKWPSGIDDLLPESCDLLVVTVFYPE